MTHEHDWAGRDPEAVFLEQEMLSGHVEGQALKMLVGATRARRVLEIGLFTGYSALAMAEALPADGRLVACELDAEVADLARRAFSESPAGGRITVEVGPAADTLAALAAAGEEFDLVFIDADKAGYADYLAALLDTGLLAPHGLVGRRQHAHAGRAVGLRRPHAPTGTRSPRSTTPSPPTRASSRCSCRCATA